MVILLQGNRQSIINLLDLPAVRPKEQFLTTVSYSYLPLFKEDYMMSYWESAGCLESTELTHSVCNVLGIQHQVCTLGWIQQSQIH